MREGEFLLSRSLPRRACSVSGCFSRRAERAFLDLPQKEARRVKEVMEKLKQNPRTRGTIKLEDAPVASYRYRVGDIRVLFDIDDEAELIEVLDIRKRDERTYK